MTQQAGNNPYAKELFQKRAVIVSSTGGHLAQAVRWSERLSLSDESLYVTFDSPQSRSLLSERPHIFVPYVAPRDVGGILRTAKTLLEHKFVRRAEALFSTGAGVALACSAPAIRYRKPLYYFESVSRFSGPSATGRLLGRLPKVRRGTQHNSWSSYRWPYIGSLLDEYISTPPSNDYRPCESRRIFVSLGTIRPYRFDRLIDSVLRCISPTDHVVWQLGCTKRADISEQKHELSAAEFEEEARAADVVVTHAGVGSLLSLLEWGISPIVVPRRHANGEHVDDHQQQVASALHERGLVLAREADELVRTNLVEERPKVGRR